MICKVIEGEEEISSPPCHEWNTCKTQQRHNHFHFLHKVFSEHNKILIFWTANVFLAHAPLFHHIFVTFVNNTWRGILFSSRNQIFADLKSWLKSAAPFKNPQHFSTQKDLSSQSYCQSVMHFYFCVLYFFLSISVQLFDWMFNKEQPLGTLALCLVLWCRYMFRGFQQLSFGYLLTMINRITRYSAALYLQTLTCSHGITEWG